MSNVHHNAGRLCNVYCNARRLFNAYCSTRRLSNIFCNAQSQHNGNLSQNTATHFVIHFSQGKIADAVKCVIQNYFQKDGKKIIYVLFFIKINGKCRLRKIVGDNNLEKYSHFHQLLLKRRPEICLGFVQFMK